MKKDKGTVEYSMCIMLLTVSILCIQDYVKNRSAGEVNT